jgi:hypothetical protein
MRLYLLDTHALASALRQASVEPNAAFRYFSVWLIFTVAVNYYEIYLMGPPDLLLILHGAFAVLITSVGLHRCYLANGGTVGKDLIGRFVTLALPITIKLQIVYELVYWSSYLAYPRFAESLSDSAYELMWRRGMIVLSIAFLLLWFWRMRTWLLRVNDSR